MNYHNIKAMVIGGTSGVGFAVSTLLAQKGIALVLHGGRNKQRFRSCIRTLHNLSSSSTIHPLWLPITKSTSVHKLLHAAELHAPNILIVAYGPVMYGPISQHTPKDWSTMAAQNFVLPSALISKCFTHMNQQQYARIIVFGADWSTTLRGYKTIAAYAAAKWALCSVIHSVSAQATSLNFRCFYICPGIINTSSKEPSSQVDSQHTSIEAITRVVMQLLEFSVAKKYSHPIIGLDKINA